MNISNPIKSFVWKFLERASIQIATFITTLVLARLLSPSEYGVVSLVTIFITIATVFVQGGFNTALIQKLNVDDADYSSVLLFSLMIAIIFYILIFIGAPYVANFYKIELIKNIMRVVALTLFPGAVNSVQVAYLTRRLEFDKIFVAGLIGAIVSGIIGCTAAFLQAGAWAIVIWQLTNTIVIVIMLYIQTGWFPKGGMKKEKLKKLVPFGGKILASNLLVAVFQNIRALLIGKIYSAEDLAFFNKGKQFPQTIMDSINGSLQSVSLPLFSQKQDQPITIMKKDVRKLINIACFLIYPIMIGLMVVAKPLITILLTEKWIPSIVFCQIFALTYMTQPPQIICAESIKACGLSSVTLKIEIIRKISEITLLLFTLKHGTIIIALSAVFSGVFSLIISMAPNKKYLRYSYREQVSDIFPNLFVAGTMGIIISMLNYTGLSNIQLLVVQVVSGIISYISLAYVFRLKGLEFIVTFFIQKREDELSSQ